MPYATTELNIHQLAHNNSLLEARILELEEENKKLLNVNATLLFNINFTD